MSPLSGNRWRMIMSQNHYVTILVYLSTCTFTILLPDIPPSIFSLSLYLCLPASLQSLSPCPQSLPSSLHPSSPSLSPFLPPSLPSSLPHSLPLSLPHTLTVKPSLQSSTLSPLPFLSHEHLPPCFPTLPSV